MEPKGSLPRPQKPTTGLYPKPDEYIWYVYNKIQEKVMFSSAVWYISIHNKLTSSPVKYVKLKITDSENTFSPNWSTHTCLSFFKIEHVD